MFCFKMLLCFYIEPRHLVPLRSSFLGRQYTIFQEMNWAGDCFPYSCHLGSHIPSARTDLLCAVFLPVQTMLWLPVQGIVNLSTELLMHVTAHRGCTNTVSLRWNLTLEEKSLAAPGNWLPQQHTVPNAHQTELHPWQHTGPSLTQLSYLHASALDPMLI